MATQFELKSAIAKTFGPWVAPASIDAFFGENQITVAPATFQNADDGLIAYAWGSSICGTGGCRAFVFRKWAGSAPEHPSYKLVTKISPARLPISVLPTSHGGWHDIGVKAANATTSFTGALSFDGQSYDSNPTLPSVPHVKEGAGQIVLGPPGASPKQCRLR
jgi:hypothetical protein